MIGMFLGHVDELHPRREGHPGVLIEYLVSGLGLRCGQLVGGNDDPHVLVALLEVSIQVFSYGSALA
jgi:hypothetical protein